MLTGNSRRGVLAWQHRTEGDRTDTPQLPRDQARRLVPIRPAARRPVALRGRTMDFGPL